MNDNNLSPLAIMPRESWTGQSPSSEEPLVHPIKYVFCMNTRTVPCATESQCRITLRTLYDSHRRNRLRDIRYNFIVTGDGNVYEGRGWHAQGFLPEKYREYNPQAVVIGFVGHYTEVDLPDVMVQRRNELVRYGVQKKYIADDFQPYEIFERKSYYETAI